MSTSPPQGRGSHASSPSGSQTQSTYANESDIPLPQLITYLLASKRSLSSISTVWRANELVTSARSSLENSVVLEARTDFLRRGISQQARVLRKVKAGVEGAYKDGVRDFQVCSSPAQVTADFEHHADVSKRRFSSHSMPQT